MPVEVTRDYSRKWFVMAAVALGVFVATIDGSIVNIALPTLEKSLNAPFALVQWVVLAYLLTVTTLMLSIGRLSDMIGKRPLFLAGFIIFTLGSLACGLSPTIGWLIASRVLQAVGAAMDMALGNAIVTEAFPPSERGKALGLSGLMVSLGVIIGPTLGGLILSAFTWHFIFFVNLPIGIIGTLAVLRFVPRDTPPGGQRFDFAGAGLLFVALLSLLVGLTLGQNLGFAHPLALGLFAAFVVFMLIFVTVERRVSQPMVDLRLFANRLFSINLTTGFMTFISSAGTAFLMPFYLQDVLGYTPRNAGLLLAVMPVALGITAPIAGSLSDRFGSRRLTAVGLLVLLGAYIGIATLSTNTSTLGYILRFLPFGVGMGLFQSPNNSAIMGTAPRERLGVASGLLSITRTLGQTTGIAVLGSLWANLLVKVTAAAGSPAYNEAQVHALNITSWVVVVVIFLALMLSLYALRSESRASRAVTEREPAD